MIRIKEDKQPTPAPPRKRERKTAPLSLRIGPDLKRRLQQAADREERSLADFVSRLLERAMR